MCGIAGVIAWADKYRTSRQTLERMSSAIAHRGPDGEGIWFNHEAQATPDRPQAALAHRRLAIIDPNPRANQPFTDGHGRWIVFNGEIYNFRELRKELEQFDPQYEWKTACDTEVLLRAYAQWGQKCVERLNGMFAFAVWDENAKDLYLARDRMGQKPLYYALAGDANATAVAFASELGALKPVEWIGAELDLGALTQYLALGYIPTTSTFHVGVVRLGAQWLKLGSGSRDHDFYFRPQERPNPIGDADAARSTRGLVLTAVKRQLVADMPLGCLLSGGIDSSVIAAAMRQTVPREQRVLTFSIGFDDPRYDETAYARQVADHLGTEHHCFTVKPDAAEDLPRVARVFGEPLADSSALPTHYLARQTRQHVKAALSGDGGDELFGGYDRYRAMLLARRLRLSATPLPWMALAPLAGVLAGGHPKSRAARVWRLLAGVGQSAPRRYEQYMRLFSSAQIRWLLSLDVVPYADLLAQMYRLHRPGRDVVQAALATDRDTYLPGDLLVKLDRASMLHALEVRSPFMDHELVEFAARLSTDQLLKGGPKRMLREAFAADLPAFVFKRPKMGFAVPIGEWFRGELRPMLRDHLFAASSFAKQHFNIRIVERLVEQHEQQRVDHSQRLYALLMLELWWRERG